MGSHNCWVGLGLGLFCALGLVGGLVLGFVGGLVLWSGRGLVFGSSWLEGSGGGGFPLALVNTVQVFLGTFGGGEQEATGHLVEPGVVWVFDPDDPRFSPVETGDSAHLHARGVRDVDFGADEGVVGTIPPHFGWVAFVAGGGGGGGGGRFFVGGGHGSIRRVIGLKMPSGKVPSAALNEGHLAAAHGCATMEDA